MSLRLTLTLTPLITVAGNAWDKQSKGYSSDEHPLLRTRLYHCKFISGIMPSSETSRAHAWLHDTRAMRLEMSKDSAELALLSSRNVREVNIEVAKGVVVRFVPNLPHLAHLAVKVGRVRTDGALACPCIVNRLVTFNS